MKEAEKTPETLRFSGVFLVPNYTIPKIKRELKHKINVPVIVCDYTIPKIKRELKRCNAWRVTDRNYTIPKIKRELKLWV